MGVAGVALWSWNVETNDFAMEFALWALPVSEAVKFQDLSERIHRQ